MHRSALLSAIPILGIGSMLLGACQLVIGVEDRRRSDETREASAPPDSASDDAASFDAGGGGVEAGSDATCDPAKPFGTPTPLSGIGSVEGEFGATLSADELEIFYTTTKPGEAVVHRSTRPSRDAPFPKGSVAEDLSTIPAPHWSVSLSADGLALYVTALGTPRRIYRATRSSREAPFGTATRVTFDNWTGKAEEQVFVTGRGQLYIGVQSGPQFDLYITPRPDGGATLAPVPLVFFNTVGASEAWPVESSDGRIFYYESGDGVASQILESRRSALETPFPAGVALSFPASPRKHPVWLSPDACRLYLVQDNAPGGAGGADLWVASRPP